ncbi:MAG: hypothetical protein V5A25_12765 [Halovenus sp.]
MSAALGVIGGLAAVVGICLVFLLPVVIGRRYFGTDPFDLLAEHTSDETAQHNVYADVRSTDGLYSIANTQPGIGLYAADEARSNRDTAETERRQFADPVAAYDCADPWTCPDCSPLARDD